MLVRPSLVLQVRLTPESYSEATEEEIKRSYIYLAQPLVQRLPEDEAAEGNVMRLSIRIMRPYWDTSDAKARELWDGVMPRWLLNVTRNISVAMHNYNEVEHPEGCNPIDYAWVEFDFGTHALFRVKTDAENRIPLDMPQMIELARRLMNERAFGQTQIALIRMPSSASYEQQLAEAKQRAHEREEQEKAAEAQQEQEARHAAAQEPCETDGIVEQETAQEAAASSAQPESCEPCNTHGEGGESDEALAEETRSADAPLRPTRLAFDIDYRMWGIEYADGTVKEFDSHTA